MNGSISFTSIVEYYKIYGDGEDFDEFLYLVRVMDSAFVEAQELKKKGKAKDGTANTNAKNNHKGGRSRR